MSIIQAAGSGEVSTGFYSHTLDQSLKFNDADSPYLKWTPASQGNLTTFTFSFWFKRSILGSYQEIFHEYPGSGERSQILFMNDDTLKVELEAGNTNQFLTNMVFRDTSAWYNIVVVFNSGDSTEANRVKIYVNGVDQADTANGGGGFSTANYPSQSATSGFNRTNQHEISTYDGSDYHLDGYLAEVNFIDGTALTAASFGETKNGIWIPKDTSGLTFGTNGFHLTFKDDVVSEGFNTAIYEGNSTTQSISGLGFSPGLVWVKDRDNANSNAWSDVVRGRGRNLISNATNAEVSAAAATDKDLISFDADGFSVGQFEDGTYNNNGSSMVAWCWEAGGAPTADNSAGAGATPTAGSVKIDGSNLGSALAGSIAATRLSADTSKGFSIVTYTGNYTAGATVAHGLGAAPKWILIKKRGGADDWFVYHDALGATKGLNLNTNAAEFTGTVYNNTAPTDSVFSLGQSNGVNENSQTFVAYCWAEISGYSKFGSFTGNGGSQAIDVGFTPAWVMLRRTNGGTWGIFDNTRQTSGADRNLQMLGANSSAAETTNSQMTFSGNTFNDNGYLSDSGATVLYMAFGDTREAAFFKDVSGSGQHWSPVNLDYRDSVPDTPTNNFSTLRVAAAPQLSGGSFSNGNLKFTSHTGGSGRDQNSESISTILIPKTGKWYAEVRVDPVACFLGVGPDQGSRLGPTANDTRYAYFYPAGDGGSNGQIYAKTTASEVTPNYGSPISAGDILGVYVDMDNSTPRLAFSRNGQWASGSAFNQSNPTDYFSLGDTFFTTDTDTPGQCGFKSARAGSGTSITPIWNFGQDSSFDGNFATDNANTDANGHGSFAYAPPTDALSLCSQNLPDVDIIDGTEHFNTVLYTGTGSSNSVTGVGFQPDWVWGKRRDDTGNHWLNDAVRGATKGLHSDSTNAEYTDATVMNAFNSDGFTVVSHAISNASSATYVAWNWLASTAFSNDASATGVGTIDSTGKINTKAGFSIISYTGNGTDGATVAHGLSQTIEALFVKRRDNTAHWQYLDKNLSSGKVLLLSSNVAESSYSSFSGGGIDNLASATFSLEDGSSNGDNINASGGTYIAYCFHSVEGYSKVGSYVGNANADGPFVHTGFRPAWLLLKNAADAENWYIWDGVREPINIMNERQHPNLDIADQTSSGRGLDFLSNGFKIRGSDNSVNGSGDTHIYLAFADQPFKFSNAR